MQRYNAACLPFRISSQYQGWANVDRRRPPIVICLVFVLFVLTLFLMFMTTTTFALQQGIVYNLQLVPTTTTDAGTGTHSMAFNSPYVTYRHVVAHPANIQSTNLRFTFNVSPMIPIEASQQVFTWDVIQPATPTWGKLIHSSVQSVGTQNIILNIDASQLSPSLEPSEPYIFEITGRVGYTYGQNNIVQYEDRVLRVMMYLHYYQDPNSIQRPIGNYFSVTQKKSTTSGIPQNIYETLPTAERLPTLRLEQHETFTIKPFSSSSSSSSSTPLQCQFGSIVPQPGIKDVIFGHETSQLYITTGATLLIASPMYHAGVLFVQEKATLTIDVGDGKAVTLISYEGASNFVNQGNIYIKSGILRIIGQPVVGTGNIIVGPNGTFEFDPKSSTTTFGATTTAATNAVAKDLVQSISTIILSTIPGKYPYAINVPILYSEGTVVFISGKTTFYRPIVSLATSLIKVGMAASLYLTTPSSSKDITTKTHFLTYIFGGIYNGISTQTDFSAMNELGLICGGKIVVEPSTTLIFGATSKFDGLGRLLAQDKSNITISIPFYDLTSSSTTTNDNSNNEIITTSLSTAGIYFSGPQTERLDDAGFICIGCSLTIDRGGLITSTGILTYNPTLTTILIKPLGFLHFIGKYATNILTGKLLTNTGDLLILNGAVVDFDIVVQSTTHLRILHAESKVYFSNKLQENLLYRNAGTLYSTNVDNNNNGLENITPLANNPTHLFALYNNGILIIRDGVRLRLATQPNTGTRQSALFYTAGLYNSGDLIIGDNVNLEFFTFTQSIEPLALVDVSEAKFKTNLRYIQGTTLDKTEQVMIQHSPNIILQNTKTSFITQCSYQKYKYNDQMGIIVELPIMNNNNNININNNGMTSSSITNTISQQSELNIIYGNIHGNTLTKINALIKLYPGSSLSFGDQNNIPIQQYITSNGYTITNNYNILKYPSAHAIVDNNNNNNNKKNDKVNELESIKSYYNTLNKDKNNNNNNNILKTSTFTIQGGLYCFENSTLHYDLIYDPLTLKLSADHLIINSNNNNNNNNNNQVNNPQSYSAVLDNTVLNIYTNLKTKYQSILLNPLIGINGNNPNDPNSYLTKPTDNNNINIGTGSGVSISRNTNTVTTLSKVLDNDGINHHQQQQQQQQQIEGIEHLNIKYPYTPAQTLVERGLLNPTYFPSHEIMGLPHPKSHSVSTQSLENGQQQQYTTLNHNTNGKTMHSFQLNDDGTITTNTNGTINTNTNTTTNNNNTLGNLPIDEIIQSIGNIIATTNSTAQRAVFPLITTTNGGLLSAQIQRINIIPITTPVSTIGENGQSGTVLNAGQHSYLPEAIQSDSEIRFDVEMTENQLSLIIFSGNTAFAFSFIFAIILPIFTMIFVI